MLIDILNSSNYISVNRDAIRILGLSCAVYCSELLSIFKKAVDKKKLVGEDAFKVDRKYITNQTSLTLADQLKCDVNLKNIGIIQVALEDPDVIKFNVEAYASLLASEDVKLLKEVKQTVKKNPQQAKEDTRNYVIKALKDSITCKSYKVLIALKDWIDAIMGNPDKFLTKPQIEIFSDKVNTYSNGDEKIALEIIKEAIVHQYIDAQWAINSYEKGKQIQTTIATENTKNDIGVRRTIRKKTSDVGDEVF